MKIKDLKNYGIPSSILNIWEKNPSPYLLPLQEDAVKNYGILSCGEGSTGLPRRFASRNDRMGTPRDDKGVSTNEEGRMQYAPTGRMDSRFRGNDKKGNGNDKSGSTRLPAY